MNRGYRSHEGSSGSDSVIIMCIILSVLSTALTFIIVMMAHFVIFVEGIMLLASAAAESKVGFQAAIGNTLPAIR